jgi:multidrug efflux pump subunit AcrB
MNIPAFSVRNSLLANLLCILLVAAGIFALVQTRREAFPSVDFDMVIITTVYPGAPPLEVEKLVTVPIEKELREVTGIDEIKSTSRENVSVINVQLDPDAKNKRKVVNDIQRAVDRVQDLPAEIEDDPVVFEITTDETPVILVSLSGSLTERALQEQADVLEDRLLELKGVASIQRKGWRDDEVWVEVDPQKMLDAHISFAEVMEALARKNIDLPAGKTTQGHEEFNIRTTAEFRTPEEIENVIIRANDVGNWLRIKDVASVRKEYEDEDTISKTMGTRAIQMLVVKRGSAETVDSFRKHAPPELKLTFSDDISFYVKRRLRVLTRNGYIGFILVIISLMIFLNRPVAIFTAMGIPIALLSTFAAMAYFGITINLISMFGLIIVLGMLVDDGIIIAENSYRYVEGGMDPRAAAIKGASEVIRPVTGTILTTIAAFAPLLFMQGIIGKFVSAIPKVVIIALLASMIEAFIILPSHMADFIKKPPPGRRSKKEQPWFGKLLGFYTRLLNRAISRRYLLAGGFVLTLVLALYLAFGVMKFILFPGSAIETFYIRGEAPVGTALEQTEKLLEPIEKIVSKMPPEDLDNFTTIIGAIEADADDPYAKYGSHVGQITVFLTPAQGRTKTAAQMIDELREKTKDIKGFERLYYERIKPGPPTGKAIQVTIRGEDYKVLEEIGDEFKAYLSTIDSTTYMGLPTRALLWLRSIFNPEIREKYESKKAAIDIVDDHEPGKGEIRVVVDEDAAAKAFLTPGEIARSVRNAFEGGTATTIKPTKAEEEIDVVVRFPEKYRNSMKSFDKLLIPNKKDNLVPLTRVAHLEKLPGVSEIRHLDGKRALTVMGDVDEKVATSNQINSDLARHFRDIPDRYPGYSVTYGGEEEDTQESVSNLLRSFLLALLLIFLILATTFRSLIQPFVVLLAIPFGLIGVVFAFLLHSEPFSFMALLGIVGLTGVVVNDSIVLVDFINKSRIRAGKSRRESLIEAGRLRLRPVILTTLTTIGGLVPLAYGIGGGDPFLAPAALAIVWGLVFATFLTLFFIPCVYAIVDDIALHVMHRSTVARARRKAKNNLDEQPETPGKKTH